MKKLRYLSVVFTVTMFVFLLSATALGKETVTPRKLTIQKNTISSLLMGISSDNLGLRTSSAYFLGEYKSDEALIPLLKMLKSDCCEEARIMAAVSLFKLNSGIGNYSIYKASQFDESEKVRAFCKRLYLERIKEDFLIK